MAAKIKEGLRDIKESVVSKFTGPKYADNLLGESLADQLRKATAKELLEPSDELNTQVVDTINQDIANGKDSKEIVSLLKKRLRTDNPHKQWLAVGLVGRVMKDCSAAVGLHQEELLQEVARTMARPAKPDTEAGRQTRQAAKTLLRSYGRAAAQAFRAAARGELAGASFQGGVPGAASGGTAEAASVVAEVKMLIEQAHANTELLSEMLVAGQPGGQGQAQGGPAAGSGGAGGSGDEFENELTQELVTEVSELRGLFDAYLEQMQGLAGQPEVDELMVKALEAVDMLEGAMALQQDVACNQLALEQQATGSAGGAAGGAGAGSAPGAAAAAAVDLISLDDDFALPQPPPVLATGNAPADPFAGSEWAAAAAVPPAVASPPAAAPPAYPAQQPYPPAQYPAAAQPQHPAYAAPPAQPYGQPAYPYAAPAHPTNPFAAGAAPAMPPPYAAPSPAAAPVANPFAGAAPAAPPPVGAMMPPTASGASATSVDAEWAMFFAGRTGAAGGPAQ